MKTVKLYRISEKSITVPEDQSNIEIDHLRVTDSMRVERYQDGEEPAAELHFKREVLPIRQVYRSGESYSIAVERDLEEIICSPYKEALERQSNRLESLSFIIDERERSHQKWWSMPWYKRAWRAIKGESKPWD